MDPYPPVPPKPKWSAAKKEYLKATDPAIKQFMRNAHMTERLLHGCKWLTAVTFRASDYEDEDYPRRLFRDGLAYHNAVVTVGAGMSTGGVVSAVEIDGAKRYLDAKGKYLLLLCAEGYYLPDVDRANGSYELMSASVPGFCVAAAARVDYVDEAQGFVFTRSASTIVLNPDFRPSPWLSTGVGEWNRKVKDYVDAIGGNHTHPGVIAKLERMRRPRSRRRK